MHSQTTEDPKLAARVIHRKGKSEHVTQLLTELKWFTVKNGLNLDAAYFMYRVDHGQVPANICELLSRVRDKSQRSSRQSDDLYTRQTQTLTGKGSLSCRDTALGTAWHLN